MRVATSLFVLAITLAVTSASAQDEEKKTQARAEFQRGGDLAKAEAWADALAAFQHSHELVPHPSTLFNIGMCERVLGRFTRARENMKRALADASLPSSLAEEARTYLSEIERLLAHVSVELSPAEAGIAIDGRPLLAEAGAAPGSAPVLVAGLRPAAPGESAPSGTFELVADPGTRVIVLSRKGFRDIVRQERLAPGARTKLKLELERLPATLRIEANVGAATVRVNDVDVGAAPLEVSRPAGIYRVVVHKPGFVPHEMNVTVGPGDEAKVDASLAEERVPVTKRWWFWAGAAGVLAGGAALTYALTRPEPSPPPYNGGSTGWVVGGQSLRW